MFYNNKINVQNNFIFNQIKGNRNISLYIILYIEYKIKKRLILFDYLITFFLNFIIFNKRLNMNLIFFINFENYRI